MIKPIYKKPGSNKLLLPEQAGLSRLNNKNKQKITWILTQNLCGSKKYMVASYE